RRRRCCRGRCRRLTAASKSRRRSGRAAQRFEQLLGALAQEQVALAGQESSRQVWHRGAPRLDGVWPHERVLIALPQRYWGGDAGGVEAPRCEFHAHVLDEAGTAL